MIDICPNPPVQLPDYGSCIPDSDDSGTVTIHGVMMLFALLFSACALLAAYQNRVPGGSPHGESIRTACSRCHSAGGFIPIRSDPDFDHKTTGFQLAGVHKQTGCRDCHESLVFSEIGTECADCHADIHRRRMGADCAGCHSIRGWRDVANQTDGHRNRFPLLGAHAALGCESCHTEGATGRFLGLRTDCSSCHLSDYLNTKSVDHQAAGFSLNCETCHSMDGWFSPFNHGGITGFVLAGSHAALDCADCHTNLVFEDTSPDCAACHLNDYNATSAPNHAASGFPQECALCHSSVSWQDTVFDHSGTQFPLTGRHVQLDCLDCHSSGQYSGLPANCYACHSDDYTNTTDPGHVAAGFPLDCSQCHSTSGWNGADFVHNAFPIYSGAHANEWSSCSDCHQNPDNYSVFTCTSCHGRDDTDERHHEVSGYVYNNADCYSCHPNGRGD